MPKSPLRATPDYLENPRDGSTLESWLKISAATIVDTSIQPDEDQFFADLATSLGHTAFSSSYLFTPELEATPDIMAHDVHVDPLQDSQFQRLDQDTHGPTQGLAALGIHSSASINEISSGLKDVQKNAQEATKALQSVPKQAPAVSTPTPAPAPKTPSTPTPAAPSTPTQSSTPKPQAPPIAPPGPKPTGVKYDSRTAALVNDGCPNCGLDTVSDGVLSCPSCGWEEGADIEFDIDTAFHPIISENAHIAWFQSNPFMQFNNPSPMNPAGQYNDMNYNPRPTYFEQGSGDSSFANLHSSPNGNYTRDSLNYGGVTDMLVVPPADPRWGNQPPKMRETMPVTPGGMKDPRTASLARRLDRCILAKRLSDEDNPYIRDYSEVRPLNNSMDASVNKPELDPNDPQNPEDSAATLHQQPSPRSRAMGPQSLMGQFDPNNKGDGPGAFIETVSPGSADGTRFSIPSYKTQRPSPGLPSLDFIKDH